MSRSIVAIAFVLATPSLGCPGPGGGGLPPPPRTAAVSFRIRFDAPSGTVHCNNLRGSFTLTPQRLTGAEGTDHEVTRSFDVAGFTETSGRQTFCTYSVFPGEDGLKSGTWRVDVRAGIVPVGCTEQFNEGTNALFFTNGSAGCSRTGFPP